eukprot:SAG22_NODE_9150_length_607_cov_1.007874_2_plen_92_part_00
MTEVGIALCNLSDVEQELIVQAGAFGEHSFTSLLAPGADGEPQHRPVAGKYITIVLPASSKLNCTARMARFVNDPSYAFPWHGRGIPIPFQ